MMNFHFLACELSNVGVIPLGHTGEHNATRVTIDATEWQEEYPNGALALLVRNPNGIVYPAQVETNGYVLTWNITRDETAIAGNGEIELILSADGYVVKSERCTTQIDAALSQNADDPPTGTPEWVSELLGSLDNIKDANDTIEAAKTAADEATDAAKAANEAAKASVHSPYIDTATQNWMVWSTETNAYRDTGIKAVGPQGETGPKGETGSIENLTINGKAPDASGAMTLRPDDLGAATAEEVSQLKDDMADKLGKTETAADSAKLGGKTPEYYTQPANLLINSNFMNPVNRLGATSGTIYGYAIDGWIINGEYNVEDFSGVGLALGAGAGLIQKLANYDENKQYTAAFNTSNGLVLNEPWKETDGTWRVSYSADVSATVYWAVLYEGTYTADNLPPPVFEHPRVESLKVGNPVQPRNLLDNSDFRNPVNQRGQTDYTSNGYTIDRWELYSGAVGVSSLGNITTSGQIYQKIAIPTDKVYTFAIENDAGIALVTGIPANGIHSATLGNALIRLTTIGEYVEVVIEPSEGYNIAGAYWAALYEGSYTAETLPPYVPKGYAAELAECLRYFVDFGDTIFRSMKKNDTLSALNVQLPTNMRVIPTVEAEAREGVYPDVYPNVSKNGISWYSGSEFTLANVKANADL